MQKVVDGNWESVFQESEPQFVPDPGTPYDLMVAIDGNELQVILIADPERAPEAYSYGPWEIQGDQIDQGKVGVFSWAMGRTEFDFVRVESIDGTPFLVASPYPYNSPTPATGLHSFPNGETVKASVDPVVDAATGVRRRATGWTGFGSVPESIRIPKSPASRSSSCL